MAISIEDWMTLCTRTINGHLAVVDRLDDNQLNTRPELAGANTAFQLVTHAFAATEWWCTHAVLGRPTSRVRREEFVAAGAATELHAAGRRLLDLLAEAAPELSAAQAMAIPSGAGGRRPRWPVDRRCRADARL